METKTIQPIVISKDSGNKYDVPEVRKYIQVKKEDGWNWTEIANGLQERGFDKISPNVCNNLYKSMTARSVVTHTAAKEVFDEHTEAIKESYNEAISVLGVLVKKLRKIVSEIDDDDTDSKMQVLKAIPFATNIMKAIRENVEFQASLQDTMVKEGKAHVEMTPAETMEYINKYQDDILKERAKIVADELVSELNLSKDDAKKIVRIIQKQTN